MPWMCIGRVYEVFTEFRFVFMIILQSVIIVYSVYNRMYTY